MGKIRVLLVDDHTVVRQGLRRLLESDEEIEIVGEAGDGRTATELAQRIHPNVVVMDIALPELNGIEATRQIIKRNDGTRVLILTMHADDVYVRQALKAGARGYLLKDSEDLDLLKAIKAIGRGGSFFSPAVSKVLLEGYLGDAAGQDVEDNLALLTDREREVLQLIAEGKTNKEVAALLSVSINTVETHRKHIMEKLDLHNTAEIVRFALRKKIVH
ncbi:MAG: response regulator transcription factor [Deltaproteobacteria bacterium]|nr:MAG: response regulator transcription factor [Deltaproteobacteria bacterium]TMA69733.1 MAG: response regulator transcription factor [Deltaproteobacteria bacterium]TMB03520.1 MAG: response regulator transcription factor [Deltaproteobacteria bacterium]TMB45429.1 MAG: response regulator transcription factor [Deltaproteobacteria bacterium]